MLVGGINGQEKYLPVVEPALYANAIFQPGVTYSDKYEVADASAAKVYAVTVGTMGDPATGVSDYGSDTAGDSLITVLYNNLFQESKKFYTVQGQVVPYNIGIQNLAVALEKIRVRRDISGLACLVEEGTKVTGNAITASNIEDEALALRQAIADENGVANVAICSNRVYNLAIKAAGSAFQYTSDGVFKDAVVGKWLGMLWVPTSHFAKTAAKYYNKDNQLKTVNFTTLKSELVVYDFERLSILEKATDAGIYDGHPTFNGSAAQAEVYTGYAVTNAKCVAVHKVTSGQ